MGILIRMAERRDINGIMELLKYIARHHHEGRPDIFLDGGSKYNAAELEAILNDADRPIFVAVETGENAATSAAGAETGVAGAETGAARTDTEAAAGSVLGYCFCIVKRFSDHAVIKDYSSLYIDDFCVDPNKQKRGVGKLILNMAKEYAKQIGVYEIDLNVWEFNEGAIKFYERCGFVTQRRHMELIL